MTCRNTTSRPLAWPKNAIVGKIAFDDDPCGLPQAMKNGPREHGQG